MSDDLIKSNEPRSAGSLQRRRVQQAWPADREFKILSIDGGGIRGIFPAIILAELEERFLGGNPIAEQFDLITGTSTGGIIALGLAAGLRPRDMANLYVDKGREIFPPLAPNWRGRLAGLFNKVRNFAYYRYDREALHSLLEDLFKGKLLGDTRSRLCIPSADGNHGDVYIFKTPHHPDYQKDQHELMLKVACATSAAPTFFQPLDDGGYRFLDGGIWANNPVMIGVVDALSCFDVDRHKVSVLSVGCGDESYVVGDAKVKYGGKLHWYDAINAAMSFQSLNALGQTRLLLGAERVLRVAPTKLNPPIQLDDWTRAKTELPPLARKSVDELGVEIARRFFAESQEQSTS